jgi:squalene-hopene/tetraprenyl-beta-curcumene cyclase
MSAMFFSRDDARDTMSSHARRRSIAVGVAGARGASKGAWQWYEANLDPWENHESGYYGASLVALALGQTPASYRRDAAVARRPSALTAYLASPGATPRLHDRLALLWASARCRSCCAGLAQALIAETFSSSRPTAAGRSRLGPWMAHPDPPPSTGSHAYATAFTAFALQRAGVPASHAGLAKALAWLRAHQDPRPARGPRCR